MAKIYVAFLLFATVLFAAPPRFSRDCLTQKALQRQELRQLHNEKTRALIPNSIFSRALAKGTRWGAVAAVTGEGRAIYQRSPCVVSFSGSHFWP